MHGVAHPRGCLRFCTIPEASSACACCLCMCASESELFEKHAFWHKTCDITHFIGSEVLLLPSVTALSIVEGQSESLDSSCVKGPLHSFTVNKQCLKLCLVFCSYGCYSSGRPLPGPPGPFEALLLSALLRQDLASRLWTGPWACLLPPTPSPAGLEALFFFSPAIMPEWEVAAFPPSFLEAAQRLPCSQRMAIQMLLRTNLSASSQGFCSIISPPLLPLPGWGPLGFLTTLGS